MQNNKGRMQHYVERKLNVRHVLAIANQSDIRRIIQHASEFSKWLLVIRGQSIFIKTLAESHRMLRGGFFW